MQYVVTKQILSPIDRVVTGLSVDEGAWFYLYIHLLNI
jgi:hypothetical protein